MIKAVFLDFYNTLVHYEPPRELLQAQVCREFGLEVSAQALRKALPAADDYYYGETSRSPVENRPEPERRAVYLEYESRILKGAGVEVPPETALSILSRLRELPLKMALFSDVLPTMKSLKQQGLVLGLVSNVEKDMSSLYAELGLPPYLDFVVTSRDAPPGKPHPDIFLRALERAGVPAAQALHVGDQYHIDVVGARGVGIQPLLLDRDDFYPQFTDCPRLRSLNEIEQYL